MQGHTVPEAFFFLDPQSRNSLQSQIREQLVSMILSERLVPGAKLPGTRRLADYLNVSRITITLAFQELVSQGYLEVLPRSGFAISKSAPISRLKVQPKPADKGAVDWSTKLPRSLAQSRRNARPLDWHTLPYPFVYGQMDYTLFNHSAWRDCSRRALGRRDFLDLASDAAAADDPMLVNYICSRTLTRRGISARPEEILVTVGAQNALWLTMQLLVKPGLRAVCENPGYPDVATALRWHGAEIDFVDIDEDGLCVDQVPSTTDLVFATPSHHAPTAVTMSRARRKALLEAAERHDFIIIEDDYEFEMSFLAPPSPALKSLDQNGRVLYAGSFSKSLFPGLRLGFLVGPEPLIREARLLRSLMLRHPPGHLQRTTAYFLALGYFDAQIRDMRKVFQERRKILTEVLNAEGLEISGASHFGGTNLWIKGPEGLDSMKLAKEAREEGVLIEPGAPFFHSPEGPVPYFRLAYSSIATDKIEPGVGLLARRIRQHMADQ